MSAVDADSCWVCDGTATAAGDLPISGLSRCESCGFVFRPVSHQEITDSHDDAYFDDYSEGRGYTDQEPERRFEAGQHVRWLERCGLRPPGELLEIGSAAGYFVAAADAAGWSASGIEPNDTVAEHARTHLGVDVRTGFIEDQELVSGGYDVVAMWHVLEHIPQPLAVLQELWAACRPGGHIAIEVPNMASREARALGADWSHWAPHAHVSHFAPTTLPRLLSRAGFRVTAVETYPVWTYVEDPGTRLRWRLDAMRRERALPRAAHPSAHPLLRVTAQRAAT